MMRATLSALTQETTYSVDGSNAKEMSVGGYGVSVPKRKNGLGLTAR